MRLEIYITTFCRYCLLAKKILTKNNIYFTEINVDLDQDKKIEMRSRTGGKSSVPQIFISGSHIGGYKELSLMEKEGKLKCLSSAKPNLDV